MPLWTSRLRCRESVWYHPTQIWGPDPTAQQPSGHCGINLCLPENGIDLQVLSKQPSLPASDWETGSNNMTWTTSDMSAAQKRGIAKRSATLNNRGKIDCESKRQKILPLRVHARPASNTKYIKKNTIYQSNMKCNESSEDICLSKICSAFQTAHAHVTVVWSASGTHKAQEIKAVNKRSVR